MMELATSAVAIRRQQQKELVEAAEARAALDQELNAEAVERKAADRAAAEAADAEAAERRAAEAARKAAEAPPKPDSSSNGSSNGVYSDRTDAEAEV